MGLRGKLVALGISAILLAAGIAGPLYPWVMEVVGDPDGDTAVALTEIRNHLWGAPAEAPEVDGVRFNKTKLLLLLGLGAFVGVASVRIASRSKSGAATTAVA